MYFLHRTIIFLESKKNSAKDEKNKVIKKTLTFLYFNDKIIPKNPYFVENNYNICVALVAYTNEYLNVKFNT